MEAFKVMAEAFGKDVRSHIQNLRNAHYGGIRAVHSQVAYCGALMQGGTQRYRRLQGLCARECRGDSHEVLPKRVSASFVLVSSTDAPNHPRTHPSPPLFS